MPAIGAAAFLAALEMFILMLVSYQLFKWLVQALVPHIPGISRVLSAGADVVAGYIEGKVSGWVNPHLHTLQAWFATLATRIAGWPAQVLDLGQTIEQALQHLVTRTIPGLLRAAVKDIRHDLDVAETNIRKLATAVAHLPGYVDTRIKHSGEALTADLMERFRRGIDRLYRDTIEPEIVGIEQGVKVLDHALDKGLTEGRAAIRGVEGELGRLAKRLDIPIGLLETLIATVGIAAAVDALETLASCRGKMKTLCTSDPNLWADFIAGLALLAAWPGLVELTEFAQEYVAAEVTLLRALAVDGATL